VSQQGAPVVVPAGAREGAAAAGLFGDRLAEAVKRRESQLVLGLDPNPAQLWPRSLELAGGADGQSAPPATGAARAVAAHCRLVIEAVAEHCVAVKPQLAWFERLGAPGWAALSEVVQAARDAGLLVIADAKRGDVDVTAVAYAEAFLGETETPFGTVPGLGADALTVNPLLGSDSLEPFVKVARGSGAGLFILARTSNPGAADLQDRELAGGMTVSTHVAALITSLGSAGIGDSGFSDIGAVIGATAPHRLERLREAMPHAVLLLPGVGVQGGQVKDLAAAFIPGRAGGLPSASRSIVGAHVAGGGSPEAAAKDAAARLREVAWTVSG
jgi:orotidine-5'-phosphate decarboxylase